jgi:hypothetical protein
MAKLRLHISTQPNKTSEVAEICWRNQPQLLIALRVAGSALGSQATEIVLFIVFAAPLITVNFNFLTRRRCVLCAMYMQLGNYCGLVRVISQVALCFNFLLAARVPVGHVLHPANRDIICNMIHIHRKALANRVYLTHLFAIVMIRIQSDI